jgi:protein FAM50
MSEQPTSRFTPQNQTTHERLSTHTVGLVALSDFRKKRAQVLEQQEREAREAASATRTNVSTPDRALTATPGNGSDTSEAERQKKKRKRTKPLVSFHGDLEGDEEETGPVRVKAAKMKNRSRIQETDDASSGNHTTEEVNAVEKKKIVNPSVAFVPKFRTPKTIQREEAEKEALRKEFLELQKAIKVTEIAIPFVFYDGTNIPGGTVRVKKGDHIWLFLDKSRKVGAELGVGSDRSATARRDWARVSVDDLMLVRGTIIIPPVSSGHLTKT